jgi:putative protein kinase ArgK-like GTPase of G3E family
MNATTHHELERILAGDARAVARAISKVRIMSATRRG